MSLDQGITYPEIAATLIRMQNNDLAIREQLIAKKALNTGYHSDMEALHIKHANALSLIIEQIGYPSISLVGTQGANAAWIIIQHAISLPQFMKDCFTLLKLAVSKKDANPLHLAYLEDRIATFEGRPQSYGTAFDWDEEGILSPLPYDSIDKLNERRKALGLNSLQEQTQIMREQAKLEQASPPENYKQNRSDFDQWREKVGWLNAVNN